MNNLYKLFAGILVIISCLFLASCEEKDVIRVDKPVIELNETLVTWDSVSNALKYEIQINSYTFDIEAVLDQEVYTYDINQLDLIAGMTYSIKVRTISNDTKLYRNSLWSNTKVYYHIEKLDKPILELIDNNIIWESILNADIYDIYINDIKNISTTKTIYNINDLNVLDTIKVIAKSEKNYYEKSDFSNSLIIESKNVLDNPLLSRIGNKIYWTEVSNARSYELVINEDRIELDNTIFQYELLDNEILDYEVYIKAIGDHKDYFDSTSNIISYSVRSVKFELNNGLDDVLIIGVVGTEISINNPVKPYFDFINWINETDEIVTDLYIENTNVTYLASYREKEVKSLVIKEYPTFNIGEDFDLDNPTFKDGIITITYEDDSVLDKEIDNIRYDRISYEVSITYNDLVEKYNLKAENVSNINQLMTAIDNVNNGISNIIYLNKGKYYLANMEFLNDVIIIGANKEDVIIYTSVYSSNAAIIFNNNVTMKNITIYAPSTNENYSTIKACNNAYIENIYVDGKIALELIEANAVIKNSKILGNLVSIKGDESKVEISDSVINIGNMGGVSLIKSLLTLNDNIFNSNEVFFTNLYNSKVSIITTDKLSEVIQNNFKKVENGGYYIYIESDSNIIYAYSEGKFFCGQIVKTGECAIDFSDVPTLDKAYRFVGWFKDNQNQNSFDFNEIITNNLSIYASWELKTIDIDELGNYKITYSVAPTVNITTAKLFDINNVSAASATYGTMTVKYVDGDGEESVVKSLTLADFGTYDILNGTVDVEFYGVTLKAPLGNVMVVNNATELLTAISNSYTKLYLIILNEGTYNVDNLVLSNGMYGTYLYGNGEVIINVIGNSEEPAKVEFRGDCAIYNITFNFTSNYIEPLDVYSGVVGTSSKGATTEVNRNGITMYKAQVGRMSIHYMEDVTINFNAFGNALNVYSTTNMSELKNVTINLLRSNTTAIMLSSVAEYLNNINISLFDNTCTALKTTKNRITNTSDYASYVVLNNFNVLYKNNNSLNDIKDVIEVNTDIVSAGLSGKTFSIVGYGKPITFTFSSNDGDDLTNLSLPTYFNTCPKAYIITPLSNDPTTSIPLSGSQILDLGSNSLLFDYYANVPVRGLPYIIKEDGTLEYQVNLAHKTYTVNLYITKEDAGLTANKIMQALIFTCLENYSLEGKLDDILDYKAGYYLAGWATSAANANNKIIAYSTYQEFPNQTNNLTLYSVWLPIN